MAVDERPRTTLSNPSHNGNRSGAFRVVRGNSKQLAVIEDMVVGGSKTLIDVFLNAVDVGHVEGGPVLNRPVAL